MKQPALPAAKEAKSSGLRDKIVAEVRDKVEEYEGRMSGFVSEFNEWSDLFTVKRAARSDTSKKRFSNPRMTEMFRAVNALATLETRMMTAQDPYFDLAPMDLALDNHRLSVIQAKLETQLRLTQHKRHLLKACMSKILFGTVIIEEPYRRYGLNPFGRQMWATGFKPRSLLQVAFDRSASDIDEADWVSVADVVSSESLRAQTRDDPDQNVWIGAEVDAAMADGQPLQQENRFILQRLTSAGYPTPDKMGSARELILYRGKLDALNDGLEYVAGLVNRKYLVRFHANDQQMGPRSLRVARWIEYELEPLAYGLGKLLASLHKSMDSNRQRVQDSVIFDTYSMWVKSRLAGINDSDFIVAPFNILEADDVNGIRRLEAGTTGATLGLKLDDMLKAEFRAASGATDTLQALITEATASEVSLAQNEALRNISVKAEIAAEPLIRQHLERMHADNVQYMHEPVSLLVGGKPRTVYPADLWYDVDFQVKVTTDKDYKPQRLKSLGEMLQILTSIRNEHPDKFMISVVPIVKEMARSLGINLDSLIVALTPDRLALMQLLAGSQGGGAGPAPVGMPGGAFPSLAQEAAAPMIRTPVGPVLTSP